MNRRERIRVLLTVPHLRRSASPYREMMAIARHLPGPAYELTICSLRDGGFNETAPRLAALDVPSFVVPFRPTGLTTRHVLTSLRSQKLIDRRGPFHIQHSLDFTSSPFEALMARMRSRYYIYSQRNLNQNGHRLLLRAKMRLSNRIVSIADNVTEFLHREGADPGKVRKIYHGIDAEDFPAPDGSFDPAARNYLLAVAHIEPLKRHQDIIRCFSLVASEYPRLRLKIAGHVFDSAYFEGLKTLVGELGLEARVEFLGPRDDIPVLLRGAWALLSCSESEAFGWGIVEAMAMGTPVIAAAAQGPREVVRDGVTGLLVPVGDPVAGAAAIRSLLRDPALSASLAANARNEVLSRFSAAEMVSQIGELYQELLAERS